MLEDANLRGQERGEEGMGGAESGKGGRVGERGIEGGRRRRRKRRRRRRRRRRKRKRKKMMMRRRARDGKRDRGRLIGRGSWMDKEEKRIEGRGGERGWKRKTLTCI